MKTATGTRENIRIIEEYTSGGLRVEVLEYEKLLGISNASMAQQVYFMEKQHIRVRQIALYLNNDKVTIEKGAMSYFQGNIQMVSGVTLGNALGRMVRGAVTGEQMAQPEYTGSGLLVLEPPSNISLCWNWQSGNLLLLMTVCSTVHRAVSP